MPNKYTFAFTPLAEQDIDSVLEYISENLNNVKAANDMLDKIEKAIDNACVLPYGFPDCKIYFIVDDTIRHVTIDNYVMIYGIDDENKRINILRFRYAKMNLTGIRTR